MALDDLEIRRQVEIIEYYDRPEYKEESWRLAVMQTPMKDHQLMLVWKTLKE